MVGRERAVNRADGESFQRRKQKRKSQTMYLSEKLGRDIDKAYCVHPCPHIRSAKDFARSNLIVLILLLILGGRNLKMASKLIIHAGLL